MTIKRRNHLLICLDGNNYSRKVLLRGASLAKKYGYTFETIFFCSVKSGYTMFHFLNMVESKNLSKRLGAIKFTLKKTVNEQNTAKELVDFAKDNQVKEIVMSGAQKERSSRNSFWGKVFFFDKFNYILKNMPDIVLVLINHSVCNPFKKAAYKNGRKGYLVKRYGVKTQYVFSDKPSSEKNIIGLFFQRKDTEELNGLFTFFRFGMLMYVHIRNGKIRIKKKSRAKSE